MELLFFLISNEIATLATARLQSTASSYIISLSAFKSKLKTYMFALSFPVV